MKFKDLKAYVPEIMRVLRALMLILFVFEYPICMAGGQYGNRQ